MNLKVTISIDDVNPGKGWRILGDQTEKWLRSLNEEFGVKFTLFVPSNYHRQYPISKHKDWVQELASIDWIELAAHGHFHQTSDPQRFGECEFAEGLHLTDDLWNRINEMSNEWESVGIAMRNMGWRFPGWLSRPEAADMLRVKYAALHYEHNIGFVHNSFVKSNTPVFWGHDGIQQENISIHNDNMIMFQSHIAGSWNHNVWNEQNYEQLRLSLSHLVETQKCEFKTLKECL